MFVDWQWCNLSCLVGRRKASFHLVPAEECRDAEGPKREAFQYNEIWRLGPNCKGQRFTIHSPGISCSTGGRVIGPAIPEKDMKAMIPDGSVA